MFKDSTYLPFLLRVLRDPDLAKRRSCQLDPWPTLMVLGEMDDPELGIIDGEDRCCDLLKMRTYRSV